MGRAQSQTLHPFDQKNRSGVEPMRPRILVVGDLMIDHYVLGSSSRISPEAPVQVVEVQKEENRLGGACNVAYNLAALGAEVALIGVIGEDANGKKLLELLEQKGIASSLVLPIPSRPTTQKSRILISHQQILRIDREERRDLESEHQDALFERICSGIEGFDALIASDYGKGVLGAEMMQRIIALCQERGKIVLCDPKGTDYSKYRGATLITPNKKEALEATGIRITDDKSLELALKSLGQQCSLRYPLITLSEDGIGILEGGRAEVVPTRAQEVYDVTGAGDTVIAALALALCEGRSIQEACEFANTAAAIVVAKVGSAVASLEEIRCFGKKGVESKICRIDELPKSENLVFTNGCFDLLHKGHVQYLQEAKKLGDILVVGLNSDDSVRGLKGEGRPINPQEDRAYLLASLECVDFVVIFDEPTPYELIKAIAPKVLVKGADYAGKEVVGSEFAGEVRLIDFVEGRSSSAMIAKIKGGQK